MAEFAPALAWMLPHEGGWSDDPDDPGGATNHGITLAVAQRHGIPDAEALRKITFEQMAAIYRADYWRFDGINDQRVATKLFDMAVNLGPRMAVRLAQKGLNALGASLVMDGIYGRKTEAAINETDSERVLGHLCHAAAMHYCDIAQARPASMKFLKGWLKRAVEVPRD